MSVTVSHYLSPTELTQWWLSLWPTDAFAVLRPRCQLRLSRKNHKRCTVTCVWSGVLFFPVSVRVVSKRLLWRTNKEEIDYRRWNLKLKLKWGPKTHLQLPIIATAAVKDNRMKIFETVSLRWICVFCFWCDDSDGHWLWQLPYWDSSSNRFEILFNQLSNENCTPVLGWLYMFALCLCQCWLWWRHSSVETLVCLHY